MNDNIVKLLGGTIGTIATLIASAMALVSFSYETFETKDSAKEKMKAIEYRLERIEAKIDQLKFR